MRWLCHVMDPSYLYSTGRPSPSPWSLGVMILVTMLGILWAWWCGMRLRRRGRSLWVVWSAMAGLLLGLVLYLVGPYWQGPLSARIVYLTPSVLGILAPLLALVRWFWLPPLLRPAICALACDLHFVDRTWPWTWQAPWFVLHGVGLYVLTVCDGRGWMLVAVALSCLALAAAVQWMARARKGAHMLRGEVLTPLFLPMAAHLGRWLGRDLCRIQVDDYVAYSYADILSPWFDGQAMLYAGVVAMVLTTTALCWRACRATALDVWGLPRDRSWWVRARFGHGMGVVFLVLGLGWYVAMAGKHLSHGATGSDPYCYLQMAVDLAEGGTALHRFPLAEVGYRANLPLWPLVPVGYNPPHPDGWAATVWPIGWPVLLALCYRLGGEAALLWAAPTMMIAAALLAWACARVLWPTESWWIGGLAAWLLLTSREGVWRSMVPMADGAAMALSMLAMVALLRARQRDALGWSALAGLALGMAYWVRHPLLPLFLAALPLLTERRWTLRRRALHCLVLGGAALLLALPDLLYHAEALGSPWTPESPESDLLSWRYIGSGLALFQDQGLLSRHEFGFLLPLVLYGVWLQARRPEGRPLAIMMALGFGGVLLFGLSYRALRLRDLLPLFPWLVLWAGRGLAGLWALANRPDEGRLLRRAALLMALFIALSARSTWTLQRLQDPRIATFGYLSAAQRRAFDQLASLVPDDAVVACGLGAGAIAHYSGREIVRPASWSDEEFRRFAGLLVEGDRPLYVVQDGTEMADWLARARADGHVFVPAATLNLPTFAAGGEPYIPGATVYRLERAD